jgi:hypothetical protein
VTETEVRKQCEETKSKYPAVKAFYRPTMKNHWEFISREKLLGYSTKGTWVDI